jgi:hypothetical protein
LLEGKLEAAKSGLENAEEDMDFLREQITVSLFFSPFWATCVWIWTNG